MAMTFRPSEVLDCKLKAQAEAEHVSMHALLVKAAEEYVARRDKRTLIDAAVDHVKVDFAEALRRLGE